MNFKDYLEVDAINYSLLKRVADSGYLFRTSRDSEEDSFLRLGTIVENLVIPDGEEVNYYFLEDEAPTALTLEFANKVVEYCRLNQLDFNTLKEEDNKHDVIYSILEQNGFWKNSKEETRKSNYKDNKKFFSYIESKLTTKLIVTPSQWEKANQLADSLKTNSLTKDIVDRGVNQLAYIFSIGEDTYKIRIDKLIVDKDSKTISAYDLKTGSAYGNSFEFNFYKFKYYLQQSLYRLGVEHMIKHMYEGYKADNFKFIYISSTEPNPYPVIYEMSEDWAEKGYYGFNINNRHYKGIKELTEEYNFYKNGSNIPKEVFDNNGVLRIPLP